MTDTEPLKIAVCTTFPEHYWDLCTEEMVRTFNQFWPKECTLFIGLDNLSEDKYNALYKKIENASVGGREYFVSNAYSPEQAKFLAEQKDDLTKSYRFHVCKFSHKVFALQQVAKHAVQEGYDYLIWLDADVITKQPISLEKLKEWLPSETEIASGLWRKDAPHSECGFVAYHVETAILDKMVSYYTTGKVFELSGWTDCDVLDDAIVGHGVKNLSKDISGWHVMPQIDMGNYLEHRKGQRKLTKTQEKPKEQKPLSLANMEIKTKNCIPNELIQAQVKENLFQIPKFVELCQYNDEEIVICSAGESLNPDDLRPFVEKGVKIVAVKHAIDRLTEWGIKPWACVLLDPRPHVEKFVQKPDRDVIYFVSSMVHPSVVKTLLENKCKVFGYHAFVNAGETSVLRPGDYLVSGGSATATRCISLLNECLGFQKHFHLFGYDFCHFGKPEKQEFTDEGQQKYVEVTLNEATWANKVSKKTFWTEGQFLAQAKELADLYKGPNPLNITVYGDGIGGWAFKHHKLFKQWGEKFRTEINQKRGKGLGINEWIRANT